MWLLDHKESWGLKNWCFWTVMVERILESSLACKEIKPVNPKGNQSWLFTRKTDIVAETPVLCLLDAKHWLIGKDSDAGKEWRPEEKDMTEDEMVGWYWGFDGLEFQQALGVGDGQGSLVCCSPWGCTESNTTERLSTRHRSFMEIYWIWMVFLVRAWQIWQKREKERPFSILKMWK